MPKKRILFVGEASYIATGFGTYWNEVIKRLHNTGKLEIAEIGSYAEVGDPRNAQVPWKFYPVMPNRNDTEGLKKYHSKHTNQFGEYIFDDVCLEFKPDIVCNITDFWMSEFILRSPLRKNFMCVLMPTIDGIPQRDLWLDWYKLADGILSYSEWGMGVLKKEGREGTNLLAVASPGADLKVFCPPENKGEQKRKIGIDDKMFIVGCFTPGTPVLMADWTYKSIEKILAGDDVIDAEGNTQKVLHTHTLDHHKRMLDIRVMGEPELITLTEDHEILIVPKDKVTRWKTTRGQKVIWNPYSKDYKTEHDSKWIPKFIEPKYLETGDFWAFKIPDETHDVEYIAVSDFSEQSKTGNKIPETIPINKHFLKLAGIYLANGCIKSTKDCDSCSIEISLNSQNQINKNDIVVAAKELFNLDAKIEYLKESTTRISIHNVCVTRMWKKLFGTGSATKFLHPIFLKLPKEKQLIITRGWQDCDGCKSGNRNIGNSVNLNLLLWMRLSLLRNGIVASINKRQDMSGCYDNAKQQWYLREKISGRRHEQFIHNGYLFSPIKNIQQSNYDGLTHDLTIDNSHSYVVFCKGVHNTVMRNQKRKLYYDLIEAFAGWVYQSKSKGHADLVKKTFLYLHTSYPDVGYDIGKAIKEFKIGNKVLMTYLCVKCHTAFPSFFMGDLGHCRKCGQFSAQPPNASHQCPRQVLADIIKCFDLYVQYSICEGFGMPLAEAQSAGVPTMAVNYSAMEDHLKTPGSIPINVERFFYEAIVETEQRRALPDNKDFQKKLDRFLKLSPEKKDELSKQTRKYIVEPTEVYGQEEKLPRRSWERTAAIWGNVLRDCKIKDRSTTWECQKSRTHNPNTVPPSYEMNNTEFVRWVIADVWNRPEYAHTQFAGEWARYLQQGFMLQGGKQIRIDRNYVLKYFYNIVMEENKVEQKRLNIIKEKDPQQINILDM